jgi:hypothetical protein
MDKTLILGVVSPNGVTILSKRHIDYELSAGELLFRAGIMNVMKKEKNDFNDKINDVFFEYFDTIDTMIFTTELDAEQITSIETNGSFEQAIDIIDSYKENSLKILKTPSDKAKLFDDILEASYLKKGDQIFSHFLKPKN